MMNITFNFKNFEPSDHLRDYARKRFDKLAKYMNNSESSELLVNLSVEKTRQMADIVFTADLLHISAHEESEDMYSTVDLILDKIEAQVRRMREKQKDRRKRSDTVRTEVISFTESQSGVRERNIIESARYEPKPMSVAEAAMQLDTLGYDVLVFLNSETERINVIYRRKKGDFGLIDPGTGS
jgi:putative sigma-54 modulation protein